MLALFLVSGACSVYQKPNRCPERDSTSLDDVRTVISDYIKNSADNAEIYQLLEVRLIEKQVHDYIAAKPYNEVHDLVYDLTESQYYDAVPTSYGIGCCLRVMVTEHEYNVKRYERFYGHIYGFGKEGQEELLRRLSESGDKDEVHQIFGWFFENYFGADKLDFKPNDDEHKRKVMLLWLKKHWEHFWYNEDTRFFQVKE